MWSPCYFETSINADLTFGRWLGNIILEDAMLIRELDGDTQVHTVLVELVASWGGGVRVWSMEHGRGGSGYKIWFRIALKPGAPWYCRHLSLLNNTRSLLLLSDQLYCSFYIFRTRNDGNILTYLYIQYIPKNI